MKYAKVENWTITNVVEADLAWATLQGLTPLPAGAGMGWTSSNLGVTWNPPPQPVPPPEPILSDDPRLVVRKFKQGDQVFTSLAWADVTDLTFPVEAGKTYGFDFNVLVYASALTVGHALAVNGPANPTYLRYSWTIPTTTTAIIAGGSNVYDHAVAVPASSASATATAPVLSELTGIIIPATNGTLALRVKPEAASVTVARGSFGLVY